MSATTNIDLLRHGKVKGGALYRGITDDPLSAEGWGQMQDKIALLSNWDLIISSPLSRCHTFSVSLAKQLNLPLICTSDLQEINFGDWEGKTAEQIDPQLLAQFYSDPIKFSPPNGEQFDDFQRRVLLAWKSLIKNHQGNRILIITHAGVIRSILANILDIDTEHSFRLKIDYACSSRIKCFHDPVNKDFFQLIKHG